MNTKVNPQTILIVFMLCVTVIFSTNSYAKAQGGGTSGAIENAQEGEIMVDPVPGGPGYIMVSAHDFRPFSSNLDMSFVTSVNLRNQGNTDAFYSTGLTLPHGATIKKVTLYYFVGDDTKNMTLVLGRAFGGGQYSDCVVIRTTDSVPSYRTLSQTTIANPVIDNRSYSYFLSLTLPANTINTMRFTSVRIDYEYPGYLPCVQK